MDRFCRGERKVLSAHRAEARQCERTSCASLLRWCFIWAVFWAKPMSEMERTLPP